jgi:hypothetical protein
MDHILSAGKKRKSSPRKKSSPKKKSAGSSMLTQAMHAWSHGSKLAATVQAHVKKFSAQHKKKKSATRK